MATTEPTRWDDDVLAGLMLLIALPRVVLTLRVGGPLGAEDTLASLMVVAAFVVLCRRRS